MSQDHRNEFLRNVKIVLMEPGDPDTICSKISILLDRYELTERVTDLVPSEDSNVELVKAYASALLIDGKARSTIKQYLYELKKFTAEFSGRDIKELGSFDIRNYLAKRKLSGLSNRTLDGVRAILFAFYGWMAGEEYIGRNPCCTIKPIKYQEEIRLPFSNVEIDKLRTACKNEKERAIVEFFLATGVRVAEFCDLDIEDINFVDDRVRIRRGKGDKERYTYMNDLAKEHVLKYLNGRSTGALFMTQRKDRYTKGGVRFLLHSLGDRAGVEDVHPHRFRRTFATSLASRGMQIQEIQKLMGHSNINTTMIYVTLSDAETKYAYKKFA